MKRTLILGGRLVNPKTGTDGLFDIAISGGIVEKTAAAGSFDCSDFDRIIDAEGLVVSPGFIDTHSHFRDPGFEYKEDIISGAKSAAKGGYTSIICMANTNPAVDSPEVIDYILEKGRATGINIHTAACISKGMNGEELNDFASLKKAGAIVFTDDGKPLKDAAIVYEAMEKAVEEDVVLSFHEEEPALIKNAGINEGKISAKIGIQGAKRSAEDVLVARDCMMALETGATVCIQHLSSGASVEMIRTAKKLGAKVWAEAAPHHFSLTEEAVLTYGTLAKMNPPLRTEEDRKAIIRGLQDDTVEIIATDHAPHTMEEKSVEFTKAPSGITGLETAFALGMTNLVHTGDLSLSHYLEKLTSKPAELYSLEAGSVEEGMSADIVIFDPDEEWVVEEKNFASKEKNTPFTGATLKGKVKYTVCRGEIVYEEV